MKKKTLFVAFAAFGAVTVGTMFTLCRNPIAIGDVSAANSDRKVSLVAMLAGKTAEDGVVSFTKDNYTFSFATQGVTFGSDKMTFAPGGYLRNITAYNGMESVDLETDTEVALKFGGGNSAKVSKTSENLEAESGTYSTGATHIKLTAYEETEVTKLDFKFECRYDGIVTTNQTMFNYSWDLDGSGTELDPYLIQNYDDWYAVANESGDRTTDKDALDYPEKYDLFTNVHFKLMFNPTFSDGDKDLYTFVNFAGSFDGNGKTVTMQDWSYSAAERGLFRRTYTGASVSNLILKGKITANNRLGSLIGLMEGATTLTDVTNYADVVGAASSDSVGGIVGRIQNNNNISFTATDCVNYGDVNHKGNRVGGIVGSDLCPKKSTYIRCINHGAIKSIDNSSVAGIVGLRGCNNGDIELIDCVNNGDISLGTEKDANVGAAGIVGSIGTDTEAIGVHIQGCVNNGKVFGGKLSKTTCFGGIVSSIKNNNTTSKQILIEDCENNGDIQANGYENGGIVGSKYACNVTTIKNCENHGAVSGYGQVGGIIGRSISAKIGTSIVISNCHNDGKISTTNDKRCAGIAGNVFEMTVSILDCTNIGEITSAKDTVGGILGAQGLYKSGATEEHTLTIKNCVNGSLLDPTAGYVHSNTGDTVGGILAYSDGAIKNVVFEDNVNYGQVGDGVDHGSSGRKCGGLIGYFPSRNLVIKNCESLGDVYCNETLATTNLGCEEQTAINVPGIFLGVYSSGKTISIEND